MSCAGDGRCRLISVLLYGHGAPEGMQSPENVAAAVCGYQDHVVLARQVALAHDGVAISSKGIFR